MLMSWKRPESVGGMRLLPRAEVGRQEECRVRLLAKLSLACTYKTEGNAMWQKLYYVLQHFILLYLYWFLALGSFQQIKCFQIWLYFLFQMMFSMLHIDKSF